MNLVVARTIPFGAGQGAEEMAERFAVVAENGAGREGAVRRRVGKACRAWLGKSCRVGQHVRSYSGTKAVMTAASKPACQAVEIGRKTLRPGGPADDLL